MLRKYIVQTPIWFCESKDKNKNFNLGIHNYWSSSCFHPYLNLCTFGDQNSRDAIYPHLSFPDIVCEMLSLNYYRKRREDNLLVGYLKKQYFYSRDNCPNFWHGTDYNSESEASKRTKSASHLYFREILLHKEKPEHLRQFFSIQPVLFYN